MKRDLINILLLIFSKRIKINKTNLNKLKKTKFDIEVNRFPGWDSLKHVELLLEIEKKFSIKITDKNINNFNSFKKTLKYLRKINQ